MRTVHLFVAAGILAIIAGCGNNNTAYYQEETVAIGPPRVNLYPLTAPPPGSVQPLQGSAPTRISGAATAEYAPAGAPMPAYAGAPAYAGSGYVATSVPAPSAVQTQYNPAMGYTEPFPTGNYCPPWVPAGSNCTAENMTAGMNPIVPIGDPPVIINNTATGQSCTTTSSQLNQAYTGSTYATPNYAQPAPTYAAPAYTPPPTSGYVAPYPAPTIVNTSYEPPTQPTYSTYTASPTPTTTSAPTQPNFGAPFPLSAVQPSSSTEQLSDVASAQSGPSQQGSAGSNLPVNTSVSYNASELRLVPAPDIPPGNHPSDAAPSQWFEIIRPGNGPIRIGRLTSTCVCVSPRVPNRFVGAGERALIEARIVSRPPANNLTYGIYVGVVEPVQATVDADVTISLR